MLTFLTEGNNGYLQKKTINGIDFKLLYKPTDLLVEQELDQNYSSKDIDSLRANYKNHVYFNLSMSKNNEELLSDLSSNRGEFGEMVNTLSFGLTEKIKLITSQKDTIRMLDYSYPRMYGLSKATSLILVFPVVRELNESESVDLVLADIGYGTGEVKFSFDTSTIRKQPQLNFSPID